MIRQSALRAATLVVFGGFLAGCSETGFQDMIGAGKYTPDETKVAVNQPLSAPPDLQLRPPSDEPPASQPRAAQQPPSGDLQQPQDIALSPQDEPVAPQDQAQAQSQSQPQPQQQASAGEPQDIYARWGVSRHHPDGREKSQIELNAEMREKKLEAKRQQDPNYGTIWNLGSIWSDG